jgi:methylmalonyl-CoA mutase N-terminal domain/subunit
MLRAIETGYVQREIQKAAYGYQAAVEHGEQVVVGINRFQAEQEQSISTLRTDAAVEEEQIARLAALRASRDAEKVAATLADVESRARSGENLMPAISAAVEVHATVGEISDALRSVFGEYQESVAL